MFSQYTYKQKFSFLVFFFVVLAIAAYKRSFSNLIVLYKENRELTAKVDIINKQGPNLKALERDVQNLEAVIASGTVEKEKVQQQVVDFLVSEGKGVSIFNLLPVHEFAGENYKIYSFQLDITGTYNDLISIANRFEKEFKLSKIKSLRFYTESRNNKLQVLHLRLIFQNYEKII